jgi:hypothetical protein
MSDLEFDIAVRRAEPITFRLGGEMLLEPEQPPNDEHPEGVPARRGRDEHEYVFTPPKSAIMLMPVLESSGGNLGVNLTKATFDWLGEGLSEYENERIKARLKDRHDDLDVSTLEKVVEALTERVAARPTT